MTAQWTWTISLLGSVCVAARDELGQLHHVWVQILRSDGFTRNDDTTTVSLTHVFVKDRWWPTATQTLSIPYHNIASWEVTNAPPSLVEELDESP